MISQRFLKSTLIYSIGSALPMLSGFILLPFYTNLLTTYDYGLLMLYIGFSLFVQVLVSYALDAYIGVHYTEVKEDKEKTKTLISNVAGLLLIIGVAFFALSYVAGKPAFDAMFNSAHNLDYVPYGLMSIATGFFNSFFKVYTYLLIFQKRSGRYLFFNVFNFVLTIVISVIGLYMYPKSIVGPMYGRLLSGVGIFVISLISFGSEAGLQFRFSQLKGLNRFCFPFLVYLIFVWITGNVDRFIINDVLDADRVAVFDFAIKCTLLIDFVQSGIASAINPEVFDIWRKSGAGGTTRESNRYFNTLSGISLVVISLFMVFIPLLIPVVVKRNDYYSSFALMGALSASFATRGLYHFFLSILLYLKKTTLLPVIFMCSAAVQLPLTWWLTLKWGLNGAVIASVATKVAQVVFLFLFTRKYFSITMNAVKMVLLPSLFMAGMLVIWGLQDKWNILWYLLMTLLTGLVLLAIYRNEITTVLAKFTSRKKS